MSTQSSFNSCMWFVDSCMYGSSWENTKEETLNYSTGIRLDEEVELSELQRDTKFTFINFQNQDMYIYVNKSNTSCDMSLAMNKKKNDLR